MTSSYPRKALNRKQQIYASDIHGNEKGLNMWPRLSCGRSWGMPAGVCTRPPATSGMYPHSDQAHPAVLGKDDGCLIGCKTPCRSLQKWLPLSWLWCANHSHPPQKVVLSEVLWSVFDKVAVPIIIKGLLGEQLTEVEDPPQLLFQYKQAENFCWFINFKGSYSGCQLLHLKFVDNGVCVRQPARQDFQAPAPCESNRGKILKLDVSIR